MSSQNEQRIASLDGLRAISILLVIASHIMTTHSLPILWRVNFGNLGVRVFFVISGFIITTLLIREKTATGSISLRNFYLRRISRIFPASYFYMAIVAILIATGFVIARYSALPSIVLYFSDFHIVGIKNATVGQFWSLSVEEQFYLLWPATLVLLGSPRSLWVCALLLVTAPAFRLLSFLCHWDTNPMFAFENVYDALAIGCVLALSRERLYRSTIYRSLIEGPVAFVVALGGLMICTAGLPTGAKFVIGIPLLNVGIAMLLDRYMRKPKAGIGRFLNWAPIVWIGTISYSLYLWQQFFIFSPYRIPMLARIGLSFGTAAASFYFLERPVRRWLNSKWRDSPDGAVGVAAVNRGAPPPVS